MLIHEQIVVMSEGEALIQLLALVPELEFTRGVAGVGTDLEHGDDHDFHFDRRGRARRR